MVALNYNPELVRNIRKGMRNKTINMEENPQIVMPVNSVANPLKVLNHLMDFDSVPENYRTLNISQTDAATTGNYTTMNTLTVPAGYYYFIWGIKVMVNAGNGKDVVAVLTTDPTAAAVYDSDNLWAGVDDKGTTVSWNKMEVHFTSPIALPTGTVYVRVYHDKGSNAQVISTLWVEVRKIENRDAEGGK